jgi:hypothetical protein
VDTVLIMFMFMLIESFLLWSRGVGRRDVITCGECEQSVWTVTGVKFLMILRQMLPVLFELAINNSNESVLVGE